ncbi:MAG TPA: lasso peptide isopeptide bond-forming cyclase [Gemmatimonadaceae bacterium]|nr:lasso peptide isopeptide bond-forming cyclase [Gemmatimonadaceae bacterium]
MSGIAGVFWLDGQPASREEIAGMGAALAHRGPDLSGMWCEGPVGFAHRMLHTTMESMCEVQPVRRHASELVLVSDARIDNREELAAALGLGRLSELTDAALIIGAYERWGRECARRLVGDFAFALWDGRSRSLFCARDAMGVKPFYYYRSARLFAFASEAKALFSLPDVNREIDPAQVALFLDCQQDDRERTLYQDVRRLPAAHSLEVTPHGSAIREYWRIDPERELHLAGAGEYVEAFREAFAEAVRVRLRSAFPVGATLSGGIDSSSIVCMAREIVAGAAELHTFSLVFPELPRDDLKLIDERAFIDCVTRTGGVQPHFVRGDQLSPLGDAARVLWHLDEPHFAPNLYLHWGLFGAARDTGARVLLDGFDGDTAVGHGFGRLDGLIRRGEWNAFEREVRGYAARRQISVESILPHFGLPYLQELARRGRWVAWTRGASELVRRFQLSRRSILFEQGLLPVVPSAARNTWRGLRRRRADSQSPLHDQLARRAALSVHSRNHRTAGSAQTEREGHVQGLAQPLYQLTLEIADKSAAAFGVEPRYPFFDRRLIELCVALPEVQKFDDGWSRLIFRRAMEGVLPREIQWRPGKANLAPNFRRRLRSADQPVLDDVAFRGLEPYADVCALREIQRRFQSTPITRASDRDAQLLFRATMLAAWLSDCWNQSSATGDSSRSASPRASWRGHDHDAWLRAKCEPASSGVLQ